ncbi:MATE family efflux transporter [Bradyrhizobium sp. C-145]|uniref:MATE family efflux transporter n=1 Tax=Bradyrhizobium sp. C-145 TaxID=574727 RepID=UPI00201B7471|nr:MATE family efflux transporter [Bradyrhizobium sp. C-145]UQR63110.1 MATE family efflux transporter [Bradyrhizobium sp. C-145]
MVPTLLMLAIPNALVMFAQLSIGLVEMYFLARLGVDVLAGVSLVVPVLSWIGALSQGAVGGGVVTAIARALGRGDREGAGRLVWGALALSIGLGSLTTAAVLWFGPSFYESMGAHGASLSAALVYSHLIFGGAILIWTFNLMLAAVRGTGNMALPLIVVCGGAVILVPLSAVLIFGYAHFPAFGVRGGAIAILIYYAIGSLIFIFHLWRRSGVLRPPYVPPRLEWTPIREILRIGGLSAIVSSTTNLTIAIVTGFVAVAGVGALAGYGAGARLEFLLVPLSYGIGGPAGIMIGTNIGAGRIDRALRVAWTTVLLAGLTAESVGLAAAIWPEVWIGAFSRDTGVIVAGSDYLRTVGPMFGFFGIGYAMYCVGQGTGGMRWPVAGACLRAAVAILGGLGCLHAGASVHWIFLSVAVGMASFGCFALPGLIRQSGFGPNESATKCPA